MAAGRKRRPAALWVLVGVLVFQAISGLAVGIALAAAPDGSIMRMPLSLLEGSPFTDFLIPGLVLGIVLGVLPVVAATWR